MLLFIILKERPTDFNPTEPYLLFHSGKDDQAYTVMVSDQTYTVLIEVIKIHSGMW